MYGLRRPLLIFHAPPPPTLKLAFERLKWNYKCNKCGGLLKKNVNKCKKKTLVKNKYVAVMKLFVKRENNREEKIKEIREKK
jgi:threonine synthase